MVNGVFDSGQSADYSLIVGNVLVRIKGDIEVDLNFRQSRAVTELGEVQFVEEILRSGRTWTYPHEDPFALEVDICNC